MEDCINRTKPWIQIRKWLSITLHWGKETGCTHDQWGLTFSTLRISAESTAWCLSLNVACFPSSREAASNYSLKKLLTSTCTVLDCFILEITGPLSKSLHSLLLCLVHGGWKVAMDSSLIVCGVFKSVCGAVKSMLPHCSSRICHPIML